MLFGPALCYLAPGAEEHLDDAGADDGGAALLVDGVAQALPLGKLLVGAAGEAGLVPQVGVAQPHIEDGHPGVGPLADGSAGSGHGAVDLAIPAELAEKDGHKAGHGIHADLALHGQDGRDAGLGQQRPESGQGAEGIAAVAAAGAFAGGEHDQAGPQVRWQGGDALGDGLAGDYVCGAVLLFEPQVGSRRVGVADQGAVTDEVEDVVTLPQLVDKAIGGDPNFLGRIAGEGCEGHIAQGLAGPLQLAPHVDGREGVAGARRGIFLQIGGIGDGDQGPQLALGAELYLLPTGAGQEAGEEEVLLDD